MHPLSHKELDKISVACAELIKVHPELKQDAKRRGIQKSLQGFAKMEEGIRAVVTESMSGGSKAVVNRTVNELVALSEGRPAILVRGGDFDLESHESLPDVLRELLRSNRSAIKNVIGGVGRIEVSNHPQRSWIGTGFVVASEDGSDIVVTNRHVAIEMAFRRTDGTFQFAEGLIGGGTIAASLDLKEEVISVADDPSAAIQIAEVIYIEEAPGPDLAFLRLATSTDSPPVNRLQFSPGVKERSPIAAIGYPAKDTRATDLNIVLGLLGDVYNKKRLAPGILKSVSAHEVTHDCSTLGGNSGSPLVDLRSGAVVGLHYGGDFPNPVNRGVSAQLVAEKLNDATRSRKPYRRDEKPAKLKPIIGTHTMDKTITVGGQSVTVELPLRITVEIGEQRGIYDSGCQLARGVTVETAVQSAQKEYGSLPGVVNIRSGLHLVNGQFLKEPAVIICIDYRAAGSDATIASLPRSVLSLPVQVRAASPEDLLRAKGNLSLEGVPRIKYVKPPDLSLDAVEDEMFAVFHVSPDAGFSQLKEFLSRTDDSLTIGLYNFSAEHVEAALVDAVSEEPKTFDFVLGKAGIDKPEAKKFEAGLEKRFTDLMGDRFRFEHHPGWSLFAGHYHIKVAVRDKEAFWLSSGNWEPSNQPNVDPVASGETSFDLLEGRNREWHAVVLNEKLAKTFEGYIKYDLESRREERKSEAPPVPETPLFLIPTAGSVQEIPAGNARYFAPLFVHKKLRIQPLLTPDNYIDHVQPLVESATESIDLQNQTVKWQQQKVDPRFEKFMNTILEKHRSGVRVRFILRSDFNPEMKELLVEHGFESDQVRLLSKCHTKGIIIDSRRTLIGSHNLSEHGAFVNRDASLIIDDEEVANYFKQIFQFDWDRAPTSVRETPPGISIYRPGDRIPDGYEVISLEDSVG